MIVAMNKDASVFEVERAGCWPDQPWYNADTELKEARMARQLTAVYEKHGEWWVAYLEEIPGVNTQGKT